MFDWFFDDMDIQDVGECLAIGIFDDDEVCPECGSRMTDGVCPECGFSFDTE